ncbi:MAG: hypothetical protein RBR02_06220 [Desulfuromonadaceae bacterium]|nr:hypothetical protein [Desulfuromonadaceae bacterium]
MCVIIAKAQGVVMPTKEEFEKAWKRNPDGAGYMYTHNKKVHIRKGFMTFDDFWNDFSETRASIGDDLSYVFHFRITTHGGTTPENTHPFVFSNKLEDTKLLNASVNIGVTHNGVISSLEDLKETNSSDTQLYIVNYLSKLIKSTSFYNDKHILELIELSIGNTAYYIKNRLCILTNDGAITLIGDFKDKEGVKYSNLHHDVVVRTNTPSLPAPKKEQKEEKKETLNRFYGMIKNIIIDNIEYKFISIHGYLTKDNVYTKWDDLEDYTILWKKFMEVVYENYLWELYSR